jgi:hypothetical protein
MTKNELQTLVNDLIVTTKDKAVLLESLFAIQDLAYTKNQAKIAEKVKKLIPEKFFELIEGLLTEASSPADLIKAVSDLQTYVNKLPIVHFTLGYLPSREQIEQLATRIKEFHETQALIDYTVNEEFALAVQIDYEGKTYFKTLETNLTP